MLTLQNLRCSGKQLLSAILQIIQHNLRSGWTRALFPPPCVLVVMGFRGYEISLRYACQGCLKLISKETHSQYYVAKFDVLNFLLKTTVTAFYCGPEVHKLRSTTRVLKGCKTLYGIRLIDWLIDWFGPRNSARYFGLGIIKKDHNDTIPPLTFKILSSSPIWWKPNVWFSSSSDMLRLVTAFQPAKIILMLWFHSPMRSPPKFPFIAHRRLTSMVPHNWLRTR